MPASREALKRASLPSYRNCAFTKDVNRRNLEMSNIKLSYIRRHSSRITASPAPLLHRDVSSNDPSIRKPSCFTSWLQSAPAGGRSVSVGSHGRTKRLADLVAKAAPGRATLRFSRRTPFALRTMSSSAGFRSGGPDPERQAGIPERYGPSLRHRLRPHKSSTGSRAARRLGLVIARPCRRAG